MEIMNKVLYYLLQNITWVVLFAMMFDKIEIKCLYLLGMQVIALTCIQEIFRRLAEPMLAQLMLMALLFLMKQMEHRRKAKPLAIEIVFSYAIKEIVRMASSFISTAFCAWILGNTSWLTITVVSIPILAVALIGSGWLLRKRDLTPIGEKYSVGVLALIQVEVFAALGIMKAPYASENNYFLYFAMLTLGICFAVMILWAVNERKNATTKERLGQSLEQAARERDDLRTVNHRLGKTLPELEHKYDKLAEKVRRMERLPNKEEFAAELDALSAVRRRIAERPERVDTDTGIPGLNSAIEYVADLAEKQGVLFGCRILAGLDRLSDTPGITEQTLHQLLRNLLDNAVHAAVRAEREPKMVQCMMGVAGDYYQIDVYDSGDPFQTHILKNLGRMGNTTDGNGVGLPDVLVISARCGASIFVTHFDEVMATGATKRITVRFDGEAMVHLAAPGLGEAVDVSMGSLLRVGGYHEKGENKTCTKS